jgi:hypothetical protein
MLAQILKAAWALVVALGLVDSKNKDPGAIAEIDAWRFIVKTFREMRQAIALGGAVDVEAIAKKVSEHLGVTSIDVIRKALEQEKRLLEDHLIAEGESGADHFHEDHGMLESRKFTDGAPPPSQKLDKATLAAVKAGSFQG